MVGWRRRWKQKIPPVISICYFTSPPWRKRLDIPADLETRRRFHHLYAHSWRPSRLQLGCLCSPLCGCPCTKPQIEMPFKVNPISKGSWGRYYTIHKPMASQPHSGSLLHCKFNQLETKSRSTRRRNLVQRSARREETRDTVLFRPCTEILGIKETVRKCTEWARIVMTEQRI